MSFRATIGADTPSTTTAPVAGSNPLRGSLADSRDGPAGKSWSTAPARAPRPDEPNPLSQKQVFSASGTQGRRAAMRLGMFDEVTRGTRGNLNPTEIASTARLRGALGVGVVGEAAAKVVVARMMRKWRQRKVAREKASGSKAGTTHDISGGALAEPRAGSSKSMLPNQQACGGRSTARKAAGGAASAYGGDGDKKVITPRAVGAGRRKRLGTPGGVNQEGLFKTALSSMAKDRLRTGLKEIKTNPADLLRCGFAEIEPTRHGNSAFGCHLIKGQAEQKAGNLRRVSATGD